MCLPLRRSGLRLLSLWALSLGAMAQSSTLNFTNATALDYDPVGLMCARWEHQTVLKGDMIYIDGGLETIYDGDERWTDEFYLGLNYYLLGINTSESWNWETNLSISIWNKSASTPRPPTSLRGHLFQGLPSDPKIYLYGGADFTSNSSQHNYSSSNAGLLWAYDTVERGDWESINISEASLWQPSRGAHAEASDLGLAFYLNGEAGTVESIEVWGNLSTQTAHLEGMIILDTANATGRTAWNVSTEAMTGGTPRSGAGMVYVPEMGESGALVLVGGIAREPLINDDPASGELINLNEIQIWDVDSWLSSPSTANNNGTWYTQTATGTVPALRADFCLAQHLPLRRAQPQIRHPVRRRLRAVAAVLHVDQAVRGPVAPLGPHLPPRAQQHAAAHARRRPRPRPRHVRLGVARRRRARRLERHVE